MAENLKVTHYNDGSEVQYVQQESAEPDVWGNLSIGAYGYYNDDLSLQATYGNLYNWYTVDDSRGLCMDGWHVPSDEEFMELEMYLGMSESEANDTGWRGTNEGSKLAGNAGLWDNGELENNSEFGTSGFSALPTGYRSESNGSYDNMGMHTMFWASSEGSTNTASTRLLYHDNLTVLRELYEKQRGFSIRCLDEITTGCTNPASCNYNADAAADDGSCLENDECGVCDGPGPEVTCLDSSMACDESECPEPTEVGGNISGTWTLENSPYLVTQDILLQPSDTLIIEPGVQVYMNDNLRFDIYGLLTAEGTESDSIRFTQSDDYWLSINFADAADDNSVLSYCVIEGASNSGFQPYYGSVNANSSHPTITHNYFRHIGHNEGRTSCNGINLSSSHALVDSNRFEDIMGHGIYIDANSTPEIRGNTFIDINGYGIYVDGADDISITGNSISSRYSSGIYATNTENLTISDNVIVENNDRGIFLYEYNLSATITSNTIEGNNSRGIDMYRYNDYTTISNNSISENSAAGIYLNNYNDYMDITGNEIIDNNGHGISVDNYNNYNIDIKQNTIMENQSDGIRFNQSSYGDIIENLIVGNGSYGLYLSGMYGDCVVRNNTIDGHANTGLYWYSDNQSNYTLTAINNSITNNNNYGMNIQNGGNYNTIAYNNAYNNTTEPNYNYYGDLPDGIGISTEINNNGTVCDIAYNISANPLYIDPDNGNYYIEKESPNIDAGDPSLFDSDGTVSDIGRYPYQYDLLPTPSSIDFGLITVGTDSTITLSLSANLTDIEVSAIETSHSQFTVSPSSFTVLYGESQDVEITFTPETNTLYDGNITILSSSEDYSELLVPVTGTGFIPPDITINPQQVSMSLLEGQSGITRSLTIGNSGVDDLNWSLAIVEDSREGNQWEFNNCGNIGWSGPSQGQCDSEYGSDDITVTNGIQYWTVPHSGVYSIEVLGAKGGNKSWDGIAYGGFGAKMSGVFELTAGEVVKILVGQRGEDGYYSGGAGGGSFVVKSDDTPLIIAGGGSSAFYYMNGSPGLTGEAGGDGNYNGGDNGNGGSGSGYGSGGGGFYTNGSGSDYGYAFLNGGNGRNESYDGGFGGGAGQRSTNWYGAGGGGYSGGGGTTTTEYTPGGGGSYNAGENQDNESGVNDGHGKVVIQSKGFTLNEWMVITPESGIIPSSTSSEITFSFDATTVGVGDYSAAVHIFSNDPDEGEVIVPVTLSVFSENTSYMYADNQQVARSTDAPISLKAHASAQDNIFGIAFALSIHPVGENVPEIEGDLGLSIVVGYGADAIVTQTGPGEASIYLSGFDPPLNSEDIDLGYIMMPVPGTTENGDTYSLTFSNVSGTTEDYELIEMEGMQNITLTVITGPPEIDGLYDVYLLENSAMSLGFTVQDLDGSDIMMELTEAPDYVTLNFETGGSEGTLDIAPGFGAESAQVTLTATNSEDVPEVTTGSFDIFINHYPVLTPTETVYIIEGKETTLTVVLTDVDGDTISLSLQSAPSYVEYVPSDESSGEIIINPPFGASSGDVVFDIWDGGSPNAITTSGFTVIINRRPEFVGFGDMHVVENQVLDTLISFYDSNDDPLELNICEMPEYINYTVLADTTRSSGNGNRDCTSGVCLSIENVDVDAGTLDVYMINQTGCTYWYHGEWEFDTEMDSGDCATADDGVYFNGYVAGFQFALPGVTVTGASGGSAEAAGFETSIGSLVLGFSLTGATIPAGEGILTQVTFTDFSGETICFGEDTGSSGSTAISGDGGVYIAADWGDCFCALEVDECGVCGGDGSTCNECPDPILTVNNAYGIMLSIMPTSESITEIISMQLTDPGGLSIVNTHPANIYNTYFSGDVRPHGEDINGDGDSNDAGEFGDDLVLAPDVAEALAISTIAPGREIPPDSTNLFDSFDTSPQSSDLNDDNDEYDEGERGGDGNIYADDVILTLKRATGVNGHIRMVDNNYPYSTHPSSRNDDRDEPVDMLVLGNVQATPGYIANIPVTLVRGESETLLNGLVSGFAVDFEGEDIELIEQLAFTPSIECSPLQIPTGVDFLSLLMMDMSEQSPGTETLLGHIAFTVPENALEGMIFTISAQNTSGSSPDYNAILFSEGIDGLVAAQEPHVMINTGLMHSGPNLKSFYVLPEDASLENMFSPLSGQISGIISEGVAAINNDGNWEGSLQEINAESGYWLIMLEETDFSFYGYAVDPSLEYTLHSGANLISFPSHGSIGIGDGIPDEVEDQFTGIISEGVAAINNGGNWEGSLTAFESTKGYWVQVQSALTFSYELTNLSEDAAARLSPDRAPVTYEYKQSSQQAFYFIEKVQNIEPGDWILSYNGDEVIGARQWTGSIIDVPAMGDDGSDYTKGYMETGKAPQFKLLQDDKLIDLTGEVPAWSQNQLFMISNLRLLPEAFSLSAAYPNPFNPTTTLSFALPIEAEVSLSIYNLQGREVSRLIEGNMEAGYHSAVWNANNHASGMYFVKMHAGNYISTQKLMLVK